MNHSYAHQFCDANTLMNEKICVKHFQAIKRIVSRKKKSCGSFWQLNDQSLEGFICPYKLTNSLLHYGYLDEALLLNMFMASQIVTTACPKCSLVPVSSQVAYKRLSHNNTLQLKKYGVHKNLILQLTLAMLKKNKVTLDFLFQFFQLIQHILNFLVTVHTSVNQQTVEEFFNQNLVSSLPEKSFYSCNGNNLTPAILCLLTNIHFLFHLGILPTLRSLCQTEKIFDTPSIILAIQCFRALLFSKVTPVNEESLDDAPCWNVSYLISFWISLLKKTSKNVSNCSMHSHNLAHFSEAFFIPIFPFLNKTQRSRLYENFQPYLRVVQCVWTLLIQGSFPSFNTQNNSREHTLCEHTFCQLTRLMYNLLLDLYSQKHLVSSEICQTVFDMFLNPSTITEQISLFRNIFSFTTGSTSFGFMPVGIFFYFTQIVKCLHLLTTHWALSFDYYIRLCDFICEFSHQYEKNSYGVSFHVTHKKSLLVLLQNLLPCLCTIIQNDFKQFMEKKHDLESRLTFDSITLSKATRLTKGIVALTSSYEAIAFEPYHEDHTSIRLQKESCGEEEEIILKIQTYTEQFCYETYQWFLTIRKTVSDFSVTSLKQVTYANSANLSLLYLLESLTLQWNSLNLFCMNFWIPNLQEKTLNSLCLFQCVNTKDTPVVNVMEDFLRLILRLTRFLLQCDSNITRSSIVGSSGEHYKNMKPFVTTKAHSLLKFITSIVSFYVGSFCYVQFIVSDLLHQPVRLLYVESSAFLLDIVKICLNLLTTETFQLLAQTFMNVCKMFTFFSKKFVSPWEPLDSILFDYYSLIFLKALTCQSLQTITDQETIAICPFNTSYSQNTTFVSFLYYTFLFKDYSFFLRNTPSSTLHNNQETHNLTQGSAYLSQTKESQNSILFDVSFSDDNVNSQTPRPTKEKQRIISKPCCVLEQTMEHFTQLFCRRVLSILTSLKKHYDALLKQNLKESVVLTHYFKLIVNTNLAALEVFLCMPYHNQVLRFIIEKFFDTRPFLQDLYFSRVENNLQEPIHRFHYFLFKALKQEESPIKRSIADSILNILNILISVLLFAPYNIMTSLCPQIKHFQKTWTLSCNTLPIKEPNVDFAALTMIGFQSLEYIYYKKIGKKKQEDFFYNAVFWSSCFQEQVEFFSSHYETKFALLPLTHLTCSLNRLKMLASWKLKKPLTFENSKGFWNSSNATQFVDTYYNEINTMSSHPLVNQSSTFLFTLISFSIATIQFLCINWDNPIQSVGITTCSALPPTLLNLFQPEYLQFLNFVCHVTPKSSQLNEDDLHLLFNRSTEPACAALVLLQKTIDKSHFIQQCITILYERVHALLVYSVLIPNLIPSISFNNLEYLSVDFWIHSVDKAHLTYQIYTIWETLSSTLLIGREVFDLLYTPFIYKKTKEPCLISNQNLSCPHTVFPLCIVALTAPVWVYFITNTHTAMSRNFCNIWKEKKTLLCLELTLYMLYISISLSRSTVIDITSVTPSTLHYYAKQWQEASNKLFHIANENNSFSTLSNPSAEQSVATPRRHALADTHTFSSKKTDCGMSQTTHNVPFSRLVSQIRAHQLEAVRLLMHDSQFIQTNKELLSSVKAAKGSGSTYPCTFSTADVIRLSTSLTSFYLHRPFSTSLALLCATEAFSECYFLRYLNENCLTSQTTCSMMERKDPLEEIVFQDNLDTERFKYQHLMPVCPAHNMTDFDESFWSMPNVIHETSSIFEFKMNSLALTLVRPFDSLQTSQSRQIFHFAYLMINAAMNLFSSWLSIGDDNDACDVLVTTLVTLSHRLILPLPYYTLASHLLCLQIQKVCSKTFSRDIPFFLKNSLFQSTILYLLPALYRFWSKCLLALAEKKTKYLLTQHLIMPTCLLYTGPTLISNTYTLNSLDLLLHKLLQFYETLIKVFPILTTRSYNKNYLKEKKPLLVTYEHMFYSISFLYTKLLTLSETILTFPCFQKNTSLESTLMYFPKMDAITHDLSFVKSLETVFQCSIKIFSCLNDFPASTFFHCCMETLQSFDECTKTFLTTFLLYKEFNPLPQNSLLMTLFSLVSALTAYIVAQCVGSQYYSKLTAQVALKALRHLYHLFKMSFSLPDLLFLYYELHDLVILNLAKHTRFSSMYGYRCLQKKFIETTPTLNKVVMDTAEFLLTHSCDTVKKAAAQKTHTALEFSKPSQLNFPIEWTIIIIEIEKKKNFIRLHFWRYIPEPIRAHLVKYLVKHACHTKESNWLCSTSEWIPETNWISLQEKLQNIREDNYASAKQTVNVQSEIPYDELPLARRTRQGKKRCETDSIQRWWQKRFSIERELCRWLENFEKCLNTSFPLLQFVSGWPASFMQQSFLTLLDVAANACKIWCIQTNNNMLMEFSIFYHLVHFTLTFCNFNVECQLSCETLRVESSLKVGYEKYFKHCFEKRYLYTYQASSKKIWKSFLNGPVHLLTQYLLSFNSFKKISFSLQKYLPSHFKPSVYGISNHPIVLFLNSHDLFSHEIPWNALPTLRGHNITLGIDISVCQSLYSKWVTGTTPYLDPRTATKFLVINPSNDNSLPQKAVPHEWISSSSETSNLIFNNIFLNTVPQAQAILYNLCHKNIYIYCGHGGGSQFIHPQKIQSGYVSTQDSLQGKRGATITAMALLMGCSSIKFFRESSTQQSEVSSFAFNFHIGGAPSILGLLWDATDHDLDRFTLCCLSAWCNVWQLYQPDATCTSVTTFWGALSHSKRIARTSCYLKWLTGGACIQTGLPF